MYSKDYKLPSRNSFLFKGATRTNLNIVSKNKEKIFIVKLFNNLGFLG